MGETDAQRIAWLLKLLAAVQWSGKPLVTPDHRLQPTCPRCHAFDQHLVDCDLAAELARPPPAEPPPPTTTAKPSLPPATTTVMPEPVPVPVHTTTAEPKA